jgi:hypothetical protein
LIGEESDGSENSQRGCLFLKVGPKAWRYRLPTVYQPLTIPNIGAQGQLAK